MLRPFGGLPSATSTSNSSSSTNHIIHSRRIEPVTNDADSDFNGSASFLEESSSLGGGAGDTSDSKDSQNLKEELPREWFYDDMDLNEIDSLDEPKSPPDDEYDYDPRYGAKKRKRRGKATAGATKTRSPHASESSRKGRPPGGGVTGGRGRSRKSTRSTARKIEPPSPSMTEPPSFETAAAAVEKYF